MLENVILLVKNKKSVKCTFPNGILIPVHQSQVHVLPKFCNISQLRFEGHLPPNINEHLRNAVIRQYQNFKSELYVPDIVPDTLK